MYFLIIFSIPIAISALFGWVLRGFDRWIVMTFVVILVGFAHFGFLAIVLSSIDQREGLVMGMDRTSAAISAWIYLPVVLLIGAAVAWFVNEMWEKE